MIKQNNLLSYIYKTFETTILNKIPDIKSVDLYFNQFNQGNIDGKATPRVLIEIQNINMEQRFSYLQEAEMTIVLHVGIDIFNTFYSGGELQQTNLDYLDLLDSINTQLTGLSSFDLDTEIQNNNFLIHNVELTNIELATNADAIKVSKFYFKFILENRQNVKTIKRNEILSINNFMTIGNESGSYYVSGSI